MCDCKKEIDPKPGEVWDLVDSDDRILIVGYLATAERPYKAIEIDTKAVTSAIKSQFYKLSQDQSHDVILPNAASQPLRLEVGKVYCLDHREGRRALIISENMAAFDVIFLDEAGIRHGIYSCSKNGVFLDEASREDYAGRKSILFCLSPNQSREIIL